MSKKKKSVAVQASILKRLAAFMADIALIHFVILFPFRLMFKDAIPQTSSIDELFSYMQSSSASELVLILSIIVAIVSISYFVLFEKKGGQTPGKMLLHLYVVSETKEMKQWQLIVRSLFLIPLFPFMLLWIIDPIVMIFTKDHNRLSEMLSKTKVTEEVEYQ